MKQAWQQLKKWYWRYERHLSSISLLAGFIFDAVALKRVDLFIENFWIVVHLLMAAVGIILLNLYENRHPGTWRTSVVHFWLVIIIQFAFGGLFSTFLVFYFRSATLAVSWPFLALLAACLIANELLKEHYIRLVYQVFIFFLSLLSFAIYFVPVVLHKIGPVVFVLSGLFSLLGLALFLWLLSVLAHERFKKSRRLLWLSLGGMYLLINLLYFTNLIPPLPLALKDAGVYHSIERTRAGDYIVQTEPSDWRNYFKLNQPFTTTGPGTVYAFSAIFSPTKLDISIVHEWQRFDEPSQSWLTVSKVTLPIVGGREGGYRTYSTYNKLSAGRWRVNVITESGQVLGRIRLAVAQTPTPPTLISETH
jgi:hypothetical protein